MNRGSVLFQHGFVDSSLITRRGTEAEEEPECKQKIMLCGTNSIRPDKGKHLGKMREVEHKPAFTFFYANGFLLIKRSPLKTQVMPKKGVHTQDN